MTTTTASSMQTRLAECESQGIISRQRHSHYRNLIQKSPSHVASIEQDLETLERRFRGSEDEETAALNVTSSTASSDTTSILVSRSYIAASSSWQTSKPSVDSRHVKWNDQECTESRSIPEEGIVFKAVSSALSDEEKENGVKILSDPRPTTTIPVAKKQALVLVPKDFASAHLTREMQNELFVGLSFFGRLGYAQPPSCLHCAYRSGVLGKQQPQPNSVSLSSSSLLACQEWVLWRRDANAPLHPNDLDLRLVACRAARRLANGETVQGYRWDAKARHLIGK
jgi:hypothetical protein